MTDPMTLPPAALALAAFADAQPPHIQAMWRYALALLMVEAGQAVMTASAPSDDGAVCSFTTSAGEVFAVNKPQMDAEAEGLLVAELREILAESSGREL